MLIALIYYINTYPFNEISCKDLPKEFSIVYCKYSLYNYLELILNRLILVDNIPGIIACTFILINKLIVKGTQLNIYNQHKILAICLMISSKLIEDDHYYNDDWCIVIDIPIKELNMMEKSILILLEYDMFISRESYNVTLKVLMYIPIQRALNCIDNKNIPNIKLAEAIK